ncbi:aminoglycoside phosphotransferase family protein [Kibdelosporangium aridum]|uniref:Ser/Thr protein kinase RdoA involved in Cpx stress response, MazF antagonist n=1 Tax=Kibdelosporangium aridum TaxID=2030 RepID=A0A1W2AH26_KIBAR|nr:phosphotransferase [Kibdelosporangium aridum]SMC59923.1 Ser/Thr protein kinase RdoA involved in Cpx stress response, MazF antagonist [Kibdelosporangium aridum]
MLTDEQVAARTDRARDAAADAGRDLGLTVTEPQVLYNVFSVIVHLKPSPVVVRVPTVLPSWQTAEEQTRSQQRELEVAGWLADKGHPVVPPSPLVAREPVSRDGFSMTFWQFVEQAEGVEISVERSAQVSAQLHKALRDYPGDLPFMDFLDPFMDKSFEFLADRPDLVEPADLQRAVKEWQAVKPTVTDEAAFAKEFPQAEVRPIHGDSPVYNLIATPQGELCSDFELVTRGPVEWDMAFVGPEAEQAYAAEAGKPLDERLLRLMEGIRMLQLVACYAQVPDMPSLGEGMRPALEMWRSTKPVTAWI